MNRSRAIHMKRWRYAAAAGTRTVCKHLAEATRLTVLGLDAGEFLGGVDGVGHDVADGLLEVRRGRRACSARFSLGAFLLWRVAALGCESCLLHQA